MKLGTSLKTVVISFGFSFLPTIGSAMEEQFQSIRIAHPKILVWENENKPVVVPPEYANLVAVVDKQTFAATEEEFQRNLDLLKKNRDIRLVFEADEFEYVLEEYKKKGISLKSIILKNDVSKFYDHMPNWNRYFK